MNLSIPECVFIDVSYEIFSYIRDDLINEKYSNIELEVHLGKLMLKKIYELYLSHLDKLLKYIKDFEYNYTKRYLKPPRYCINDILLREGLCIPEKYDGYSSYNYKNEVVNDLQDKISDTRTLLENFN